MLEVAKKHETIVIDKLPQKEDIIVIRPEKKVEIKDDGTILIKTIEKKVNITKKVNETKKIVLQDVAQQKLDAIKNALENA